MMLKIQQRPANGRTKRYALPRSMLHLHAVDVLSADGRMATVVRRFVLTRSPSDRWYEYRLNADHIEFVGRRPVKGETVRMVYEPKVRRRG